MAPIGVFGGTFDPIHCGHLRTAFELWQELRLAEVRFLPTGVPPHRDQLYASAELRLKMVEAAVASPPQRADNVGLEDSVLGRAHVGG